LGGRDQEDHRPAWANHETPISKITKAKYTRDVAKVVEYQLFKCKALNQTPVPPKKKKKSQKRSLNARKNIFLDNI
jgi:hypothetical protein